MRVLRFAATSHVQRCRRGRVGASQSRATQRKELALWPFLQVDMLCVDRTQTKPAKRKRLYLYKHTRAHTSARARAHARTHTHIHRSPCPFRPRWVAAPCMVGLCLSAVRPKSPAADETARTIHRAESLRCIASHGPTRAAQRSRWAAKAIRNGLVVVIDVTFARVQRVGDDDGLHRNRN